MTTHRIGKLTPMPILLIASFCLMCSCFVGLRYQSVGSASFDQDDDTFVGQTDDEGVYSPTNEISSPRPTDNDSAVFFNDSYVHEIRLYFGDPNWYDTLYDSHATNPGNPYFPVRFRYNDIVLDPVGIRMKGFTSFNDYPGTKKSFKIDFNVYNNNTEFFGLRKLNLNNGYMDPTMLRERLFLDFAGKYVPTIRCTFTRLYINDEYFGLYTAVEQVDNTFVKDRFGSDENGNLFKSYQNADLTYLGPNPQSYHGLYGLKTNEVEDNYTDLIEFIDILNNVPTSELPAKLEQVFDVGTWLSALALNNLFINFDSYIGSAHNYYLYDRDDTGHITHILWDANMAFGTYTKGMTQDEIRNITQTGPFWIPTAQQGQQPIKRPLMENIWKVDSYNRTYLCRLAQMLREGFEADAFSARIYQLADMIRSDICNDTKKQFSNQEFETALKDDIVSGNKVIPGLLHFIEERSMWMNQQLDKYAGKSDLRFNELMTSNLGTVKDSTGDYDQWVELFNPGPGIVNTSCLYLTDDPLIPAKWMLPTVVLEDGQFLLLWLDGEPGEGLNHVSFGLSLDGGDLYLYSKEGPSFALVDSVPYPSAGTDDSYGRLPDGEGSWLVFHDHPTPNAPNQVDDIRLFINELMARNTATISDPDGNSNEYPDWTELFNSGNGIVDLSEMYLTDNLTNPRKWQFPIGTSIEPGGFLLVWADNKTNEGRLHTNFKLNATSGEAIGLFKDGPNRATPIDSVLFPKLRADVSYGRYPDGADSWVKMHFYPTPGSSNRADGNINIPKNLLINEFMAKNRLTIVNSGINGDSSPDWIEFFNAGNETADLSFMYLTDHLDNSKRWRFPIDTSIEPGGYLLVWADKNPAAGKLHTSFKLNASGEAIGLFAADGDTLIDSIVFAEQFKDVSYGRISDGGSNWNYLLIPTPGHANEMNPPDTIPPIAYAGEDKKVGLGDTIKFDGTGSKDNLGIKKERQRGIIRYTWSFTYNGSEVTLTGSKTSFRFYSLGVYAVTLTVEDIGGNTATDTVNIMVKKNLGDVYAKIDYARLFGVTVIVASTIILIAFFTFKMREKMIFGKKGVFR